MRGYKRLVWGTRKRDMRAGGEEEEGLRGGEESAAVTGRLLPIWLANTRIVVDRKFARPKLHR
ncbi:hypothetical protein An04g04120 [Aspergillus niger]|uniref:Uncharacterized protein n=2 Tax=Aspergillus niger TaxID=5061 RepID=A2QIN3_ASPNC|nr:hypothetical protein An04g04120 [Aspergillus niger]CAK38677.1 hypothetical protein An04g04120 [Aspergillus niger]